MLGPKQLPFAVVGERIMINADPPKTFTPGGLQIPDTSVMRMFSGRIIEAGLKARDKMYDNGYAVGDHVYFGKFSGVIEEWDHIIEGDASLPDDAYDWDRVAIPAGQPTKYKCAKTGAIRLIEALVVANVDDVLGCTGLAAQLATGTLSYKKGEEAGTGRTVHYIERKEMTNGLS